MRKLFRSGIQKRYLKYTSVILGLALVLASLGISLFIRGYLFQAVVEKYYYIDEQIGMDLSDLYIKSEEATAECILNEQVQESLRRSYDTEKGAFSLVQVFTNISLDHVDNFCYVDNHQNVYTRPYTKITYQDVQKQQFEQVLGDSYAKTVWYRAEDTLFGTGEKCLFICRYVRDMEYINEPGILILKMKPAFLKSILPLESDLAVEAGAGILDPQGYTMVKKSPAWFNMKQEDREMLLAEMNGGLSGMRKETMELSQGVVSLYRDPGSGFAAASVVPHETVNRELRRIQWILIGIFLLCFILTWFISFYFTRRFTDPIRVISDTMAAFDGQTFEHQLHLSTNTELDSIGEAYNQLVVNIRNLLETNNLQQEELRVSEINMLINQIKPHFLYNTLDAIRMLIRLGEDETAGEMIQALSGYLRLSLSKGSEWVTIEEELDNVSCYMDIQKLRLTDSFDYVIDCRVQDTGQKVLKLILQPLAENAVKYGLAMEDGGIITVRITEDEKYLYLELHNTGMPMEEEMMQKLNDLNRIPVEKMKETMPKGNRGYGTVNLLTRIRLYYGEEATMIYTQDEGTRCVIRIPRDTVQGPAEEEKGGPER